VRELALAGPVGQRGLPDVDVREAGAQPLREQRQRLPGDVAASWCQPDHVRQHGALVGAHVEAVRLRLEGRLEQLREQLLVADVRPQVPGQEAATEPAQRA
jgi:hypothetical protein